MFDLRRLLRKYREILLYLIFGGLTTLVNYAALWLFYDLLRIRILDALGANALAWVVAVLFAFVTNKLYVFESRATDRATLARESASFFISRLITLGVESAVIYIGVSLLEGNLWIVKIAASVLVVVLNYVFSKLIIFRRKNRDA